MDPRDSCTCLTRKVVCYGLLDLVGFKGCDPPKTTTFLAINIDDLGPSPSSNQSTYLIFFFICMKRVYNMLSMW